MKKVLSKCAAVLMSVLICGSTMSVFAASTPSVSTDVTSGYDDGTGSSTAYGEFSVGQNVKTDVYLTVDSSDVVAGVPTCVILDGKATNGQHKGDYQVYVEGNIAGDEIVTVEPDRYDAELSQLGKENISATISQDKTIFTANEMADGTITDGTIVAQGLIAGSWNGEFNFNISMSERYKYYSTIELAASDATALTVENADVKAEDIENAEAAMYIDGDTAYVKLLKDAQTTEKLRFREKVSIDLNNKELRIDGSAATNCLTLYKDSVVKNGSMVVHAATAAVCQTNLEMSNVDIDFTSWVSGNGYAVYAMGNGIYRNVNIEANAVENAGSGIVGIRLVGTDNIVDNCIIKVTSDYSTTRPYGIYVTGTAIDSIVISNSKIEALTSQYEDVMAMGVVTTADSHVNTLDIMDSYIYASTTHRSDDEQDGVGSGVSVYNTDALRIGFDTGKTYIHGGNNAIHVCDTHLYVNSGTFCSPNHGGLYVDTNADVDITGGRFYNTQTTGEESYSDISPFGGIYVYSDAGTVNISNAVIEGGNHALRVKSHNDGTSAVVNIRDSSLSGTYHTFSVNLGTINVHDNVTTSFSKFLCAYYNDETRTSYEKTDNDNVRDYDNGKFNDYR